VRILRQDASETLPPYSLSGQIATEQCSKLYSFSAGVVAVCPNEKERSHTKTVIVRRLSDMLCPRWKALCAALRRPALRATYRSEVCGR
jgi:hypothetical protein